MHRIDRRPLLMVLSLSASACGTSADDPDTSDVAQAAGLAEVPPSTVRELDMQRFVGSWYVTVTNYSFWEPPKSDTKISYEVIDGDVWKLRDVVSYAEDGAPQQIIGVDLQDPSLAGHFQWRGDGILHMIVSHWFVVAVDPEYKWAVTYFGDSNVGTGAGIDVYTRKPCGDVSSEAAALYAIFTDPFLSRRAGGMFRIPHAGCPERKRKRSRER